jgi:hypothetical protein
MDDVLEAGIEKLVALYQIISFDGWSKYERIVVVRPRKVLPSVIGGVDKRLLFLTNGQHRASVLVALGFSALTPSMYEYLDVDEWSPWSTADLASPSQLGAFQKGLNALDKNAD